MSTEQGGPILGHLFFGLFPVFFRPFPAFLHVSAPAHSGSSRFAKPGAAAACLVLAALLGQWWLHQRPLLSPALPPGIAYDGPLMLFGEPQASDLSDSDLTASAPKPTGVHITRPVWDDLEREHKQLLAGLEPIWPYISSAEKRRWLALANQARELDTRSQQNLIRNIATWGNLNEEQRQLARSAFEERDASERERLTQAWRAYSTLEPEERVALANAAQRTLAAARAPQRRTAATTARQRNNKNLVRIAASRQAQPGLTNAPKIPLQPVRLQPKARASGAGADANAAANANAGVSTITTVRVPEAAPPPAQPRVRYWYGIPITPPEPAPVYAN